MSADQPNRLLNVKEAGSYLGLSTAKLYQLMGAGELPYVKFGKARRIAVAHLDALVKRMTVNAPAAEPSVN